MDLDKMRRHTWDAVDQCTSEKRRECHFRGTVSISLFVFVLLTMVSATLLLSIDSLSPHPSWMNKLSSSAAEVIYQRKAERQVQCYREYRLQGPEQPRETKE
jgi:hypothetical protein